jgi:hypothetical protein
MSDSIATTIGAYMGYVSMVVMGIGSIVAVVNKRRCRSACCGHEATVELNIEAVTPPTKPAINISG